MDFDAFRQDLKTIAAVECKLLVISEAAVRLKEGRFRDRRIVRATLAVRLGRRWP
jgi:hypothetical protein